MTVASDSRELVEVDGDLYPADRIGLDGKPLPITDEQARQIADILVEEFEQNPQFRAAVEHRAALLAASSPSKPGPRKANGVGRRRPNPPSAGAAPSKGEAA